MAPATGDLRAILSTTRALVDYFGDTEKHGAMLIELKRGLEHAIACSTSTAGAPAISFLGLKTKGPYFHP